MQTKIWPLMNADIRESEKGLIKAISLFVPIRVHLRKSAANGFLEFAL